MTISDVTSDKSGASQQQQAANAAMGKDQLGKDTFLKLLVAQIRNQDPMNPADGLQFVTQLAQFSELEQLIGIRQDLSAVSERYLAQPGSTTPAESGKET
jgi:flagellar basal-body rod modification protein FlgD